MKTNEDYISPLAIVVKVELESAICAASPSNGGSFDDFEYEVYPEV